MIGTPRGAPSCAADERASVASVVRVAALTPRAAAAVQEGETDYTTLVDRATHDRQVTCAAESDTCGSFVVFTEPFIEYRNYSLEVTLLHPTQAFAAAGVQHGVDVDFELTYVYTSYTQFEIGFKAAFFLASLLIATAFIVAMRRLHPRRATWSYEQKCVVARRRLTGPN